MAEILGLGMTHYTGLRFVDAEMSIFLQRTLKGSKVPAEMKDPANWPEPMRAEWADDRGAAAAVIHRKRHWDAFTRMKEELAAFAPDFVVMWGDDQYENFVEDLVPPFCAYIGGEFVSTPFLSDPDRPDPPNAWGEPVDREFVHRGHPEGAAWLVEKLSERGIDIPYAYRLRHSRGLAHAFINTLLFLDQDHRAGRRGLGPCHDRRRCPSRQRNCQCSQSSFGSAERRRHGLRGCRNSSGCVPEDSARQHSSPRARAQRIGPQQLLR